MPEYVTIRNVELLSAGMKWQAVNGDLTFTLQHLEDAARAAQDPHIQAPRLKIGHSDPRFNDGEDDHDPFALSGDGEAAVGSVRNIHLANEGSMLVGDYVDVPVWLADALPSAYPSRSIEGAYSVTEGAAGEPMGTWNVTTPGGKHYTFVLTACALLGVVGPAILNLEDLRRWLTTGDGLVVAGAPPEAGAVPVDAATVADVPLIPEMSAPVESIVDDFCANYAPDPHDDAYWWWPIDMWSEGGILYVDDDEGGIQAVPYTTDDDQNVAWGDAYKVVQRYEAAPAAASLAPMLHDGDSDVTFRSVKETPLAARHAGRETAKSGGPTPRAAIRGMDFTDTQRGKLAALLGLGEDATEDQITAKLEEAEVEETTTEATAGEETTTSTETDPPAAAAAPDETTVAMDRKAHDALLADAALGREAREQQITEARGRDLDAAVSAGKIMLSSKADWERKYVAAPEATAKELAALAPGLVPVAEMGHSRQDVAATSISDDELTAFLFPQAVEEVSS